jgi:hypothetical protein
MKLEIKDFQKVSFVEVNAVFMTTLIIIINHQIGEADKLTKADISKLWFYGISRIVAQFGFQGRA